MFLDLGFLQARKDTGHAPKVNFTTVLKQEIAHLLHHTFIDGLHWTAAFFLALLVAASLLSTTFAAILTTFAFRRVPNGCGHHNPHSLAAFTIPLYLAAFAIPLSLAAFVSPLHRNYGAFAI